MASDARIPDHGRPASELLADIDARHAEDIDWRGGRAFSLVYNVGDHEHEELIEQVGDGPDLRGERRVTGPARMEPDVGSPGLQAARHG